MPDFEIADQRAVCTVCYGTVAAGDQISRSGMSVMHAECDPRVTKCPHCGGVL